MGAAEERILVVDDNCDAADAKFLLLQVSGYEARASYDGESALGQAILFQPQVLPQDKPLVGCVLQRVS